MYDIGAPELVVIAIVVFSVFVPTFLLAKLRKRYPNRLWIGILLCLLNGALAQFYLPGGLKYFLILAVLFGLLHSPIGNENAYLVTNLVAILFIWYRHLKIKQSPLSEIKLQSS